MLLENTVLPTTNTTELKMDEELKQSGGFDNSSIRALPVSQI